MQTGGDFVSSGNATFRGTNIIGGEYVMTSVSSTPVTHA